MSQLLVVGEALVDAVTAADGAHTEHPGGSPLNVAVAAARLGVDTVLATQIGADARGDLVRAHVERSGVRVASAPPAHPTGVATAHIDATGAATYSFDLRWDPDTLPAPEGFAAVHAGSIGLGLQPGADRVLDLLDRARAHGVAVSVDPNVRLAITPDLDQVRAAVRRAVELSWVVKLSDEDGELLWPGQPAAAVVDHLLDDGAHLVALTRGGDPTLLGCGDERVQVPIARTAVVDTIGAGDTFMGALLATCARRGWLGRDLSADQLRAVGWAAVKAAAITCSRPGADPPWTEELEVALSGWAGTPAAPTDVSVAAAPGVDPGLGEGATSGVASGARDTGGAARPPRPT